MNETNRKKVTVVLTDYWDKKGPHRHYRNYLHSLEDQLCLNPLEEAIASSGAVDGDEIEIVVRKTGRRPWGDRRLRAHEGGYRRESK